MFAMANIKLSFPRKTVSSDYLVNVEKNGSSLLTNLRVRLTVKLNMRMIEMIVMVVPMQVGNMAV